jgi:RNA polymerase sigma-70 factor (ECF subfamily)
MDRSRCTDGTRVLPLDDVAIARRIAAGERVEFELLMRRNNRRLYRLARATMRDDAEAQEALQEAYLAAYRGIAHFRGESTLATWLSHVVLNECMGRLRKSARRQNVIPMGTGDEMENSRAAEHGDPEKAYPPAMVGCQWTTWNVKT